MSRYRYDFSYLKGLKEKLDNNQELTEEEKVILFDALDEGEYRIIKESNGNETIDFSKYLHRYFWIPEYTGEASTWIWGKCYDAWNACYATDQETIARYYNDESLLIVNLSDLVITSYQKGKFFREEKGENDEAREL